MMLTQAMEDYLKAIYKLQTSGPVSTNDISEALEITPASVTKTLKRLAELGLVDYRSYQGVTLTLAGEKVALEVIRHHRLLELYLKQVMGYSWEQLHEEADRLEHHISEEFEAKLDEMLGYPTRDPHGHPIPALDGSIVETITRPLCDLEPGSRVIVHHLLDDDFELLHYLEERGLLPRAKVEVIEKEPFEGPITLRVNGNIVVIGQRAAAGVFTEPWVEEAGA